MRRVRVRLPAAVTDLGPGLNSLGLALSLYTTVEITERADDALHVETAGEGAGLYSVGLRHPVVRALIRMFQQAESATAGLNIRIDNQIPHQSGLGAETALLVAGVIAANNLIGKPFPRKQVWDFAAQIGGHSGQVMTALLGGLTTTTRIADELIYRSLPVTGLRAVVVLPELDTYADEVRGVVPERVLLSDALTTLSHLPLLIEALRTGDLTLLGQTLTDPLIVPFRTPYIPGYDAVITAAQSAGASGVTLVGAGPTLIAFSAEDHHKLAAAMKSAFTD
ncbi:MAG: homoserine kinase, partial [Chloroflexi bacterium]|nr:homoserine kinase [Chloroflexota bacterium]